MTPFRLMQMITLAQNVINLVVQFIKIVFKILASHLRDQVKHFLDNIGIKRPKIIYINKKLILGIKQQVVKHIENFDKVLVDLERAGVTIARAKSQFYQASIKIVGYICNTDGCYQYTSKILKILDWLEYSDTTLARVFLEIYIYYQIWIKDFAQIASFIYHLLMKNTLFIQEKEQIEAINLLKSVLTTLFVKIKGSCYS